MPFGMTLRQIERGADRLLDPPDEEDDDIDQDRERYWKEREIEARLERMEQED